jgi:protein AATF/BFR2
MFENHTDIQSKKRTFDESNVDELYTEMNEMDTLFQPFRETTIDKWNQKAMISSGIPMQKKFKVVNQSVNTQIEHILQDKQRLLKRTQVRRSDYKPIGFEEEETNPHIYDDDDFYQDLLKELIESRISQSEDGVLLGMKIAEFKNRQLKNKKVVDTRASKGRKIRYQVQEKLLNFMAPEPRGSWHDEMSHELFSSLLGASVSVEIKDAAMMNEFKIFS